MSRYTDKQIFDLAANRILILDGAMGTMIQQHKLESGLISCNAAISLCEKDEQLEKALQLLDAIQQRKLGPNMINFNAVIGACKKNGRWKQALELLGEMHQCRLESDVISFDVGISDARRISSE